MVLLVAAILTVPAAVTLAQTFVVPTTGCSLAVSNNFVQKNAPVTFTFTSQNMAYLTVTKNTGVANVTVVPQAPIAQPNGLIILNMSESAMYTFSFITSTGIPATCSQMVRIPNITGPLR